MHQARENKHIDGISRIGLWQVIVDSLLESQTKTQFILIYLILIIFIRNHKTSLVLKQPAGNWWFLLTVFLAPTGALEMLMLVRFFVCIELSIDIIPQSLRSIYCLSKLSLRSRMHSLKYSQSIFHQTVGILLIIIF